MRMLASMPTIPYTWHVPERLVPVPAAVQMDHHDQHERSCTGAPSLT